MPRLLVESPLDGASFMFTRDSIRWTPGTLISTTSSNSELMRRNQKQVLCPLKFFFYRAHKSLGGKYPWWTVLNKSPRTLNSIFSVVVQALFSPEEQAALRCWVVIACL